MRLSQMRRPHLGRGTVFRFPAGYPYEDTVAFMLVQLPDLSPALLVLTGYHAGRIPQVLPAACLTESQYEISVPWLRANWQVWIWPGCTPAQVEIIEGYPPVPA